MLGPTNSANAVDAALQDAVARSIWRDAKTGWRDAKTGAVKGLRCGKAVNRHRDAYEVGGRQLEGVGRYGISGRHA